MRMNPLCGHATRVFLSLIALAVPICQSTAAPPAKLPPVRYQIQFWDVPNPGSSSIPQSMNNYGQVVGWYTGTDGDSWGYLYDPALNPHVAVDLQSLIGGAGVPAGWKINTAHSINKHGVLVGNVGPIGGPSNVRQGFVLDLNAAAPAIVPLPNWGGWDYFSADWINDNGDIVGIYQNADGSWGQFFYNPNNPATPLYLPGAGQTSVGGRGFLNNAAQPQVGGTLNDGNDTPYRWTPLLGTLQTFPGLANPAINGINDSGTMSGYADVTTTSTSGKKTTTTTNRYPMRLSSLPANMLTGAAAGSYAHAINNTADVLISNGTIFRDDWATYGYYVDVNKLVVGTSADLNTWFTAFGKGFWYMNNRGTTSNAGQIMGGISLSPTTAGPNFILNPVPAP